jgi:iron complex outermembrane receptor protein
MKASFRASRRALTALVFVGCFAPEILAQTVANPPSTDAKPKDETVVLSVFKVSTDSTSAYQGKEANSAGRIRTALLDTSQSVSVITSDFIDDIGSGRTLDAAKFSAGVTESQFPNRLDRISIRGFQQDSAQQSSFVDGFRFSAISAGYNGDPANVDRLEIVKGPNAIIAAAGSPGGSVNTITKSPSFTEGGYVKLGLGEYLSNRAEFDITGPLPIAGGKTVAFRVIGMYTDSNGYQDNQFSKGHFIAPSLTFVLSPDTELTVKGYFWGGDVSIMSQPLDPRVGVNDSPRVYPGLKRTFSETGDQTPQDPGTQKRVIAELTHKFTDNFQARIGVMAAELTSDQFAQGISGNSLGSAVGNANPYTGIYTPGTTWTVLNYGLPNQTVVSAPAAFPNFANRTTGYSYTLGKSYNKDRLLAFQNDYVYTRDWSGGIHSTSVAGISANSHGYTSDGFATVSVPLVGTLDDPDYAASYANASAITPLKNFKVNEKETTQQIHFQQLLNLFNDHLILNGSYSHFEYKQDISDDSIFTTNPVGTAVKVPASLGFVSNAVYPTPPYDRINGSRNNVSYGVVYKPLKFVSIWAGHTQNANPPTLNNIGGTSYQAQYGDQYEFGIKASLLNGKIDMSVTHFDLTQHNVFVYDLISNTFLPLGDVTSKGNEIEINGKLTKEISVVLAAADFKARNGFGQRLRSIPDQSGALALKYAFQDGPLKGFWLMLSADYLAKRAGDIPGTININAATAAPGTVVGTVNGRTLDGTPVSPTFYLDARTIFNLTGGYTFNKHWRVWFRVDNLANKDYIAASLNRGVLTPGVPRSVSGSLTYKF